MGNDYVFLKYTDIPFSFALLSIIYNLNPENYFSILPEIIFIGSIIATTLELLNPIKYFLLLFLSFYFRYINRYTIGNPKLRIVFGKPENEKHRFDQKDILRNAYNTTLLSKTRDKITSIIYFLIILFISNLKHDFQSLSILLNWNIDNLHNLFWVLIFIVGFYCFREILRLPHKIFLITIYLSQIDGKINRGNSFDGLRASIDQNDWETANFWVKRTHDDRDFSIEYVETFLTPVFHFYNNLRKRMDQP